MRILRIPILFLTLAFSARADTNGLSSLWVVTGKQNKVYLQASIHMLKPEHYPLSETITTAFGESEVIVFEADLGIMNSPEIAAFMAEKGLLRGDKTLKSVISPETYKATADMLPEIGAQISAFSRFKPWFLAFMLSSLKLQTLGYNPKHGIDFHFYEKARKSDRLTMYLETVRGQIANLDSLTPRVQDEMLARTIEEYDEFESMIEELVAAWQLGDTGPLEAWITETYEEYPELYELLIVKRNRNWIRQIDTFLQSDQDHMVIVGAAHVVGDDGLITMLRTRGYEVRQL